MLETLVCCRNITRLFVYKFCEKKGLYSTRLRTTGVSERNTVETVFCCSRLLLFQIVDI